MGKPAGRGRQRPCRCRSRLQGCSEVMEVARLATELTQTSDDSDAYRRVWTACQRLSPGGCSVSLGLVSGGSVHYFRLSGIAAHRHAGALPLHATAAWSAIVAQRVMLENDTSPVSLPFLDWRALDTDCRSMLVAPIMLHGAALGALTLSSPFPCAFSGLESTYATMASVIAPHLRLTRSEKALKAAEQLLREALALEQSNAATQTRQTAQKAATPQRQAGEIRSTPTGTAAGTAVEQPPSAATTTAERLSSTAGGPSSQPATAAAAADIAAAPLHVQLSDAVSSIATSARRVLASALSASARPAEDLAAAAFLGRSAKATSSKGEKGRRRRDRSDGYAFEDYEMSSDDEASDPVAADAAPALAAPLARWWGPLEFRHPVSEGAYMCWAAAAWQAMLDMAAGSFAMGRMMMLLASCNMACFGCNILNLGWFVGICRAALLALLLAGCHLMLARRAGYVKHREMLVSGARLLCSLLTVYLAAGQLPQLQWIFAHKLRAAISPTIALLPFVAQVRFSRHLVLTGCHLAMALAAAAATRGNAWKAGAHVLGAAAMPAVGLYLMERATRRRWLTAHAAAHQQPHSE